MWDIKELEVRNIRKMIFLICVEIQLFGVLGEYTFAGIKTKLLMKIDFVYIHNFRKLKSCRIDLAAKETIFVGANNSGKTSAMDAMINFFKSKPLSTRDFTLSNWSSINKFCDKWEGEDSKSEVNHSHWEEHLPALDIWLNVEPKEIHYVSGLIPTLSWTGGSLGIRLRYEPKDVEKLLVEYCSERTNRKKLIAAENGQTKGLEIAPKSMWDYLDKDDKLGSHFTMKAYLLDPSKKDAEQKISPDALPLEESAFRGLIKVDIINAQRGFSDANTEGNDAGKSRNLSNQLRLYYDKHLNPSFKPKLEDLAALKAIEDAQAIFDKTLEESFKTSLEELKDLNYPGFGSPKIKLSSRLNAVQSLDHDTAVRYILDDEPEFSLPEQYNGLGYQNLISMIFKLIRFRDEWMHVGKSAAKEDDRDVVYEPLHLVLIEEPEAHLHAQVQQVFIRKAYSVLRNHSNLKDNTDFTTQVIISTHANHVAHEIDFTALRYFKRQLATPGKIATATVVNLSTTFGTEDETTRFAIRYLKTTHCDLFFADAVIMVEGPAEKILVPHFIRNYNKLSVCYISILEIGGSHAHTLRPLIESLGIITLIVTDIDSINPDDNNKGVQPALKLGYASGNNVIKKWWPVKNNLDELMSLTSKEKEHDKFPIKIAFQAGVTIKDGTTSSVVYPYTFEDCLVAENKELFGTLKNTKGLLNTMVKAATETDIKMFAKQTYDAIRADGARKAEFALQLLYLDELEKLKTPGYISEGLGWLENELETAKPNFAKPKVVVV